MRRKQLMKDTGTSHMDTEVSLDGAGWGWGMEVSMAIAPKAMEGEQAMTGGYPTEAERESSWCGGPYKPPGRTLHLQGLQ